METKMEVPNNGKGENYLVRAYHVAGASIYEPLKF